MANQFRPGRPPVALARASTHTETPSFGGEEGL